MSILSQHNPNNLPKSKISLKLVVYFNILTMLRKMLIPFFGVIVFLLLNYIVVLHWYKFFGLTINRNFYIIVFALALNFPLAMSAHHTMPWLLSRYRYYISAVLLGVVFFWLVVSIFCDVIYIFWPGKSVYKWYLFLAILTVMSGYSIINQLYYKVINVEIPVKWLSREIKIGYLSDIHIDGINSLGYLDRVINEVNKHDIDVVMINGDFIDGTSFEQHSFKAIDRFKVPVFITMWNHESYVGKTFSMSLFKWTKARVLDNEVVDFSGLQIIGIEDLMWTNIKANEDKLTTILDKLTWDKSKPSLMLLHEPIGSEIADKRWITVQLAWHTHNGQISPFNYIVNYFYKYIKWMYKIGNLSLYVWQGTWVWWPPMRLGSNNEITIIKLKKG